MSIRRTLIAGLTAVAIAVPAAAAAAQPPDMHASTAIAAAKARQHGQDLRSADARHAALLAEKENAVKTQPAQDLRSPDAVDAAVHPRKSPVVVVDAPGATAADSQARTAPVAPGQPTWAVDPQPIQPAPAAKAAASDDGVDWTTIGLGIAGSLLALGAIAALTARVRATPRTGVSV
jgi:hypothetical protein